MISVTKSVLFCILSHANAIRLPTRNRDRPPVTFIHEHKAAGSLICHQAILNGEKVPDSFGAIYDSCVENSNFTIDDYHARAAPYISPRKAPQPTCAERSNHAKELNLTFFAIEREMAQGDLCPNDFNIIGFMRKPLDMMTSELNYGEFRIMNKKVVSELPQGIIDCIPKGNCTRYKEWELYDNYFVRQMGGATAMHAPPGGITQEHFEAAKAMMKNAHLMAPMECLFADAESTGYKAVHNEFQSLVGWDLDPSYHWNQQRNTHFFTSDQCSTLGALNKFDLMLYDELLARYKC